jgi:hypothetical protein
MFESGDTLLLVGVKFHHVVDGFSFLSLLRFATLHFAMRERKAPKWKLDLLFQRNIWILYETVIPEYQQTIFPWNKITTL